MRVGIKAAHYLAMSSFIGSIFAHILLGILYGNAEPGVLLTVLQVKAALTQFLIFGGIALSVVSGVTLVITSTSKPRIRPWLAVKLALVAGITLNATLILGPIGVQRVEMAAAALPGMPPPRFLDLGMREDIFGTVNLILVLSVITLSILKRLSSKASADRHAAS